MTEPDTDPLRALNGALQHSIRSFLEIYEPLRPQLYRYCRQLTRSPWDAEDLVQDALSRAFVTLARMTDAPPNPRAWLFRVASNLWIDRMRRAHSSGAALEVPATHEPRAAREAAGTLLVQLAPQERAAVVLKDVFDFSLEEVAEALSTSVAAIKAALHRGRGKLLEPEPEQPRLPAAGVLDAFCAAFNARDMDALTALLLDSASLEVVGASTGYGPDAARSGMFYGMLYGSQIMATDDPYGVLPQPPRCELRVHRGEALLLLWYQHADGDAVRAINRVESDGDRIARFRNYFFTPEFLAEVCAELGVPFRGNGYRFCAPNS